ncbi:MAG: YfhO family protein [Clostridiales bacterium]|nr:YfhO family protein [Clostridiales bacterium]
MKVEQTLTKPALKANRADNRKILPIVSALITAVCYFMLLLISKKYPFGEFTTVVSDLEAQYAPYMFMLKSKLTDLNFSRFFSDFGYSFLLGAGKNFAGTFGYYLASPLNLLVLFFDATQVNEFIMLLMGLKLSLASAFMCAFVQERAEDKSSRWPILWGVMYAFTSYTSLFLFHIIWLDGYALLPLLLLMIERYLHNGKLTGVTVVLFFLFLSNYYIAYMAGIYSFIYLLVRMYLIGGFDESNKFLKVIGRFVLRAVLCGLTLCIILLPVGLDTIRNGDPTHSSSEETYVGFTFTGFLDRIFLGYPGDFSKVLIANMPLIFVSLLVTLLCAVFFVSKAFSSKLKKVYAIAFILIYASLCVNYVDVAWQVFDSPNWFWHREAFVFITFFLTVSYKVIERLKDITVNEILKGTGIIVVLLLFAQSFGEMRNNGKVFLYNAVIIALLSLILVGMKKTDWSGQFKDMGKILPVFLVVLTMYEGVFVAPILSSGTSTLSAHSGKADKYINSIRAFESVAEMSEELGAGFRSEYDTLTGAADLGIEGYSQYADIRGVSLFNSNSNKNFGRFLKQLGYQVNYNYFASNHAYSAPSADAFFSVGTIFSTDPDYSGATSVSSDDTLTLYQSRTVLPLAFTAMSSARDFNFYSLETATSEKNYFTLQNDWYRSLFGSFNDDFFISVSDDLIEQEIVNCSVIDIDDYQTSDAEVEDVADASFSKEFDPDDLGLEVLSSYNGTQIDLFRTNSQMSLILSYDITIEREDELYANISVPRTNSGCSALVNGSFLKFYSPGTYYSSILRLGTFEPGDTVRFTIMADYDTWTYLEINFAYFDMEAFESQFDGIDTTAVNMTEADDGYVAFTADVRSGEMILTSIPYEDGWTVTVDGKEGKIIPYEGALISIDAEPGTHDVVLRFTPPGLKYGAILSVVGIVGLVAVSLFEAKKDKIATAKSDNTEVTT